MPWAPCAVFWPPPAEARLARVAARNPRLAERIIAAVDRYAATGHGDVKRLRGSFSLRLRVGSWRVLFDQEPGRVIVRACDARRDVYR